MNKLKSNYKNYAILLLLITAFLVIFAYINFGSVDILNQPKDAALKIFVSILPQKFFVEKIGGDKVEIFVLVGPGQSPATYEPTPKQMLGLAEAAFYFRIGVPFETTWNDKIEMLNPEIKIVDTSKGIELREMEQRYSGMLQEKDSNLKVKDPHIWLDPLLVKIQARTICEELSNFDPKNKGFYEKRFKVFLGELDELHRELADVFQALAVKEIMVFHPAWGYLMDRYGLQQIPIEVEGKEPGPKELVQIIGLARQEGIKTIFIQTQFDQEIASSIAKSIKGKIISIDPLAEDYISNLRTIARTIKKEN